MFKKATIGVLSALVFFTGVISPNVLSLPDTVYADGTNTFTSDSSATIPISASISGSYTLSLPASIDSIVEKPMDASGYLYTGNNARLAFTTGITFDRMAGKALRIHLSGEGDINDQYTITDGGSTTLHGNVDDYFIVPQNNTFTDDYITGDITEVVVEDGDLISTACRYKLADASVAFTTDGPGYMPYRIWQLTADSADLNWALVLMSDENEIAGISWNDVPNGTYTGNLMFTWQTVDINTDILQ